MHPHLHTKNNRACEDVMNFLDECHERGFMWKAMGMCNEAKRNVNRCLRAQRLERAGLNREAAREKSARVKAAWSEVQENS